MWTLSTLLHNESTFTPLMFAFSFDLTISVQISQFSVASGLKEPITLLGVWNRFLKKIRMIFPPSEINLGLNTGEGTHLVLQSLSLTHLSNPFSWKGTVGPAAKSFVRILYQTKSDNLLHLTPCFVRAWWHIWNISISLKGNLKSPVDPLTTVRGWGYLNAAGWGLLGVLTVF